MECLHCRQPSATGVYCTTFCRQTELACRRISCDLEGDNVQHVGDFCYRIDHDDDDFPDAITIQQKDGIWKETYTMADTAGMWSLPWDERSQLRVQCFFDAFPVILPQLGDGDAGLVEEIKRRTLVLRQESDMYPFGNPAVWMVNEPPQILKWIGVADEGTITSMLARKPNLSTVKVLDRFAQLEVPVRPSSWETRPPATMSAILMKYYPIQASRTLQKLPASDAKLRTILHLCCAVLVELARIQKAFHSFQHGDLHLGNVFIDSDTPNVALDEIGAPAFPLGRPVLADFGRSTLNYVSTQRQSSHIEPISAWQGRPLPATEDARQLMSSAMLSGGYPTLKALEPFKDRPIVSADATLELARDLWAFTNEHYPATLH